MNRHVSYLTIIALQIHLWEKQKNKTNISGAKLSRRAQKDTHGVSHSEV